MDLSETTNKVNDMGPELQETKLPEEVARDKDSNDELNGTEGKYTQGKPDLIEHFTENVNTIETSKEKSHQNGVLLERCNSIASATSSTSAASGSEPHSGPESGASGFASDSASLSRSSSTTSSQNDKLVAKVSVSARSPTTRKTPSPNSSKSKIKNPFNFFKRKSQKDRQEQEELEKKLTSIRIDTLPQLFVTKYLGFRPTNGLYGIKHTREPLREIFAAMNDTERPELPLTQLHISPRGIHVSEHKQNTVKSLPLDTGLVPIEFISYGVQDVQFTRIFTFIVVREMSSRARKLECHAYLCDSSIACRKLALSMALAFRAYTKTLEGKPHKFQINLQHNDNTIGQDSTDQCEVTNGAVTGPDCDV